MSGTRIGGPQPVKEIPSRLPVFVMPSMSAVTGMRRWSEHPCAAEAICFGYLETSGGFLMTAPPGSMIPVLSLLEGYCPVCGCRLQPAIRYFGATSDESGYAHDDDPTRDLAEMVPNDILCERGWAVCDMHGDLFQVNSGDNDGIHVSCAGRYDLRELGVLCKTHPIEYHFSTSCLFLWTEIAELIIQAILPPPVINRLPMNNNLTRDLLARYGRVLGYVL